MSQRVLVVAGEDCFIEPCRSLVHARRVIAYYRKKGLEAHLF